jgi:hypothetical protein
MKFNVVVLEPRGYRFAHLLYDCARLFYHGLENLGHQCHIHKNWFDSSCLNLVIGGHMVEDSQTVAKIRNGGIKYIVLQSEIFKSGTLKAVAAHRDNALLKKRFEEAYLPLLQGASAIWEGVSDNLPELESLGLPAKFYVGGYVPELEEVSLKNERDIDFLFYGSRTPHRNIMLTHLENLGFNVKYDFDSPALFRNDLIARSKVNLSIAQSEEFSHLPWGRITYLLNNRCLVVGEACREQEWLEHCFLHAPTDEWVALCHQTLTRSNREEMREENYERFRRMPMTDQLEPLLEGM